MKALLQKQTKFNTKEKGKYGNCMVSCYANYLELDIEDCPAFEELFDCKKPNGFWWDAVLLWWESHGYLYYNSTNANDIPESVFNDYYFVSGISPRDPSIHHLVIYKQGKLFFDPHPDNTGIVEGTESSFEWVIKQVL